MFFKRRSSMVTEGVRVTVHPKAVCAVVSWTALFSEAERKEAMEAGMGGAHRHGGGEGRGESCGRATAHDTGRPCLDGARA